MLNQNNPMVTYDHQVSAELKQLISDASKQGVTSAASQQGVTSAAYQALYAQYIHHSHRFKGFKPRLANSVETNPKLAYGHYGREVFYSANKGLSANENNQENSQWQAYMDNSGVKRWFK